MVYLFEVVGVDVVPELAEESVVGVVVEVGLGVGHLEVGAGLAKRGRRIAGAIETNST